MGIRFLLLRLGDAAAATTKRRSPLGGTGGLPIQTERATERIPQAAVGGRRGRKRREGDRRRRKRKLPIRLYYMGLQGNSPLPTKTTIEEEQAVPLRRMSVSVSANSFSFSFPLTSSSQEEEYPRSSNQETELGAGASFPCSPLLLLPPPRAYRATAVLTWSEKGCSAWADQTRVSESD